MMIPPKAEPDSKASGRSPAEGSMVIAARILPTYYGGLGQYQRSLGQHLWESHGIPGVFLSECLHPGAKLENPEVEGWDFVHFDGDPGWAKKRELLMRCGSRPFLHNLAEKLIRDHWVKKLKSRLPKDLIAIHYVGTGWDFFGFALQEVAHQSSVPFTVWPAVHPNQWGDAPLDIRLYKKADTVFSTTDHEKAWVIKKGLPAEKIVRCDLPPMCLTMGNGLDFRSRHGLSNRPIVLFMGRKEEGKGYTALLEVWPKVRSQFPTACLVTVGPQATAAETFIGQEREGVLDLGIVSEEEKADALAACDVFCLPSAHESFGIVYLEAWFYSKPVICGTAPACRELIEEGVNGLWSSQETDSLQQDICTLLANPERAIAMGQAGKEKQEAHFTWETLGQIHLKEFCKAV
jgi:glycosyltransferase involved in cell wall biosynthesis